MYNSVYADELEVVRFRECRRGIRVRRMSRSRRRSGRGRRGRVDGWPGLNTWALSRRRLCGTALRLRSKATLERAHCASAVCLEEVCTHSVDACGRRRGRLLMLAAWLLIVRGSGRASGVCALGSDLPDGFPQRGQFGLRERYGICLRSQKACVDLGFVCLEERCHI